MYHVQIERNSQLYSLDCFCFWTHGTNKRTWATSALISVFIGMLRHPYLSVFKFISLENSDRLHLMLKLIPFLHSFL